MKKLVIGISGNERTLDEFSRDYVNNNYIECVESAGGIPIILPVTSEDDNIERYIGLVDAIILSGGHDMDPVHYGEELMPESEMPHRKRDYFDIKLIEYALKKDIPILGVCRGMQILNVYFKGSLYQDLKYNKDIYLKHIQDTLPGETVHRVSIDKSSVLSDILGDVVEVNSFHHQLVKDIGDGLKITGRAADGAVELIESVDEDRFIVGIQWHPEMMYAAGSEIMGEVFKLFYERAQMKSPD